MKNENLMSIADESGCISAANYQAEKNRLEQRRAEIMEAIRNDTALQKLVATYQAKKNAAKADPKNMARDPEMCRRAVKKRWAMEKEKLKQDGKKWAD